MTLLQPSYLWGLLALGIPIAIHLWSRKKVRTIKVGSTKFITETKSKQSNSIQLNEWWLLALRCLIICTLVFALTEPHISMTQQQQNIVYVFEPSLLATADRQARFVQIPSEGRRLLSPGFPEWQPDANMITVDAVPDYWQLAQQMEQIPADSIVVFTHAFAKAVKGRRPEIRGNINWILVDSENAVSEPLIAIARKDSVEVLEVRSSATRLTFEKTKIPNNNVSFNRTNDSIEVKTQSGVRSLPVLNEKQIVVTIIYDKAEDAQRVYLEAALRAIKRYTHRDIIINSIEKSEISSIEESDYLILLGVRPIPDIEIPILLYKPDVVSIALIESGNTPTTSFLTKKLTPQIVIEEHLVQQILQWLQLDRAIEGKIDAVDTRTVSINQLQTNSSNLSKDEKRIIVSDMSETLWMLLLVLLIGERLLARIRKQ